MDINSQEGGDTRDTSGSLSYSRVCGIAGVDLGALAKQLLVGLLGISVGLLGVILSVVVPIISLLFPRLRAQAPPRVPQQYLQETHGSISVQPRTHHRRPPISRSSQECHATSVMARSAESLSTIVSSSATSWTPSQPSSSEPSPRPHFKRISQSDNSHEQRYDSISSVSTPNASCALCGCIPRPSDNPAPAGTAATAVSTLSSNNGFVTSLASSIGCGGACSCTGREVYRSGTLTVQPETRLDVEEASAPTLAETTSSPLHSAALTPRTSYDTDEHHHCHHCQHRLVGGEDAGHHQVHQRERKISMSSSNSAPQTSLSSSSTKATSPLPAPAPRRHSFFGFSHLRWTPRGRSKLAQSSSSEVVPSSPSSRSLPNDPRRSSMTSELRPPRSGSDSSNAIHQAEKPSGNSRNVGAVTVRRSRSQPCSLAKKLKGKEKAKGSTNSVSEASESSGTCVEKENVSVRRESAKAKRQSSKSRARPAPLPLAPARTRPYEAPFYFPSPLASEHDKETYVRAAREELRGRRTGSGSGTGLPLSARNRSSLNSNIDPSGGGSSSNVDVDEFGVVVGSSSNPKSRTKELKTLTEPVLTSAPPVAVSFVGDSTNFDSNVNVNANPVERPKTASILSSHSRSTSLSMTNTRALGSAKSASSFGRSRSRPRPKSMYPTSSSPLSSSLPLSVVGNDVKVSDNGNANDNETSADTSNEGYSPSILQPDERVRTFVAEPEQVEDGSVGAGVGGVVNSDSGTSATGPQVVLVSPSPLTVVNTTAPNMHLVPGTDSHAKFGSAFASGSGVRSGWSGMLKRHKRAR